MELEKFDRQLRLMVLLTQNRAHSVEDISCMLHLSKRSIYRYLDSFRDMGFKVIKEGTYYRLDHSSPFFRDITDKIHLTQDEAITLNNILNAVPDNSPQVRHLRAKLAQLYDDKALASHGIDTHVAKNLTKLYEAVRTEHMVVLKGYSSPSSGKMGDRIVEPYLFLSDNTEVRCYEVASGMNKTFKISRAQSIELLDMLWSHKDKHKPIYTDLFHFSSETTTTVRLLLGTLATSLLLEEYPAAEHEMKQQEDGRYLLTTNVCSFKGIGRFVLGLFDDIEIIDSPELTQYLQAQAELLTQKIQK